MYKHLKTNTTIALTIAGFAAVYLHAQQYTVVDLSTLAGPNATTGPGSQAYAVNNLGTVCGLSIDSIDQSDLHAILWNGSLIDLGVLGPDLHSMAFAINSSGNSAGVTFTFGNPTPQAVRWLGTSPAGLGGWLARDISDTGVIVGEQPMTPSGAYTHAVKWSSGVLTDLGTLGGQHSAAYAIANDGRVVGMSFLSDNTTRRAFLYHNGVMLNLGTLGGANSHAYDISDTGYVVGVADRADGKQHAFRYTLASDGSVISRTDLGALTTNHSVAYGVNEAGDVVGSSGWRAFIWRNGELTNLNTLITSNAEWTLTHALAINDSGKIVGRGTHFGHDRAFLLVPLKPGDINSDGLVNVTDLLAVIDAWGQCQAPPVTCPADIAPAPNGDGTVDVSDLLMVINNWG